MYDDDDGDDDVDVDDDGNDVDADEDADIDADEDADMQLVYVICHPLFLPQVHQQLSSANRRQEPNSNN